MKRTECARELIARYIGVESGTEQLKLKVLLDLYADAVMLDAAEMQQDECELLHERSETAEEKHETIDSGNEKPAEITESETTAIEVQAPAARERVASTAPPKKASTKSQRGTAGREAVAQYAKEKKEIHARLKAFRDKNGLGCFERIVKVSNGALTDEDIRNMFEQRRMPIAKWKILDGALKHLNKQSVT